MKFTVSRFKNAKRAAGYACGYLTNHPPQGYPAWVLESQTRKVHRYSTSRGFWATVQTPDGQADEQPEDADNNDEAAGDGEPPEAARRTIADQLATCGHAAVIMKEIDEVDPVTGEVKTRCRFIEKLQEPLATILARCDHRVLNKKWYPSRVERFFLTVQ